MLIPKTVTVSQNIVKLIVEFDCLNQNYTREYAWNIADVLNVTEAQAKAVIKAKVAVDRATIEAAASRLQTLFNGLLNKDLEAV